MVPIIGITSQGGGGYAKIQGSIEEKGSSRDIRRKLILKKRG